MEVQPQAADMEEVIMAEVTMVDQEHIQVQDQDGQVMDVQAIQATQDQDIQDTQVMDDIQVGAMVVMVDTDQDGHITGDHADDGSVVNTGTGITVDGFHTGHSHTHFPVMGSIRDIL